MLMLIIRLRQKLGNLPNNSSENILNINGCWSIRAGVNSDLFTKVTIGVNQGFSTLTLKVQENPRQHRA